MTPVLMFRYRGFLVRIVNNGTVSHSYEWTYEPIDPATKKAVYKFRDSVMRRVKQGRWTRPLQPRVTDPVMIRYYRKMRLNNRNQRFYDPTTSRTARGSCSALDYAMLEINDLIDACERPPRVYFNR
jgi:hypothetical protein